ncbi:MAG TPA: tetratricopeptide repeat protein [Roseimicrobium sp.]|nr:tetratricopeptide repeat protein [Roseimicrobium sp.]
MRISKTVVLLALVPLLVLVTFFDAATLSAAPAATARPPKESTSVQLLIDLSNTSYKRGELTNALAYANQALAKDTNSPSAYYLRARIHEDLAQHLKAVEDYSQVLRLDSNATGVLQRRGESNFRAGRMEDSVSDFDAFLRRVPKQAPEHWQRGISLYYAKRYDDGRKQFESHQTVNPSDVENAVWHFLCVAKLEGVTTARKLLIPIREDRRVPMMQIYALFGGKASVEDVLAAVKVGNPPLVELNNRQFYAHLYLGLYFEALGDAVQCKYHMLKAANLPAPHYMGDVARVHAAMILGRDSNLKK